MWRVAILSTLAIVVLADTGCTSASQKAEDKETIAASNVPEQRRDQDDVDQILTIVAGYFEIDPAQIELYAPINDLPSSADELDVVQLLMAIEERLNVEIKDEELERLLDTAELSELPHRLSVDTLAQLVAAARSSSGS